MDIIQRDRRYFLQLSNGELELTEQQAKKRVERGDTLREYLERLQEVEQPPVALSQETPKDAKAFITSGKYFDNLIREFEQIYKLNEDKEEAADKLTKFCRNAISKLQHDRKNPKTDHVVIDYYILSWSRIISFLQSLSHQEPEPQPEPVLTAAPPLAQQAPQPPKDLTKQMLMIQLMQADGLFPISDALQGIAQDDILALIAGMLEEDRDRIQEAIKHSSAILLKRSMTKENIAARIAMLEEMDSYFEKLPYHNIISRIKLLIKIYKEQNVEEKAE